MAATQNQIIASLRANGGFITGTAKELGVTYQAIWDRIKRSKTLKAEYDSIKEGYLDLAETKLISKMKSGDLGALCFYLKCQGKQRGYIERVSNTFDNDLKVTFRWQDDGNSDPI